MKLETKFCETPYDEKTMDNGSQKDIIDTLAFNNLPDLDKKYCEQYYFNDDGSIKEGMLQEFRDFMNLSERDRKVKRILAFFTDKEKKILNGKKYLSPEGNDINNQCENSIERLYLLARAKYFIDNPNSDYADTLDKDIRQYLDEKTPDFVEYIMNHGNRQQTPMDYLKEEGYLGDDYLPITDDTHNVEDTLDIIAYFHNNSNISPKYPEFTCMQRRSYKEYINDYNESDKDPYGNEYFPEDEY